MTTNSIDRDLPLAFLCAWEDLEERLLNGIASLSEVYTQRTDEADRQRLTNKSHGVQDAWLIWDRLARDGDPRADSIAGKWRAFTDQTKALFNVEGKSAGYYEGVSLALSYQRGYGPEVDAPIIRNPHLAR